MMLTMHKIVGVTTMEKPKNLQAQPMYMNLVGGSLEGRRDQEERGKGRKLGQL